MSTALAALDVPSYRDTYYTQTVPLWDMMTDVQGGTIAMRLNSLRYMPQNPKELDAEYQARRNRSEFFNATKRTVKGLAGKVFRDDPILKDDIAAPFPAHWENIDNSGTHGAVFARKAFEDALWYGLNAILVDHPPRKTAKALRLDQEQTLGLRPYWVTFTADKILSSDVRAINGQKQLVQIVLLERTTRKQGRFVKSLVDRYRVLWLDRDKNDAIVLDATTGKPRVLYEVWETLLGASGSTGKLMKSDSGTMWNQTEIPVAFIYAGSKVDVVQADLPLADLAFLNIAHWNVQSDHRTSLHLASCPILCLKGIKAMPGGVVAVGANTAFEIVQPWGDVYYREHSGAALGQTRLELQDIENRMATLGLSMLMRQEKATPETATAHTIEKQEGESVLAVAARSLQDALERANGFHMAYYKQPGGSIEVCRDFDELTMDNATMTVYSQMEVNKQISLRTLWSVLEEGNALPEDFDADKEEAALAAQFTPDVAPGTALDSFGNPIDPMTGLPLGDGSGTIATAIPAGTSKIVSAAAA